MYMVIYGDGMTFGHCDYNSPKAVTISRLKLTQCHSLTQLDSFYRLASRGVV